MNRYCHGRRTRRPEIASRRSGDLASTGSRTSGARSRCSSPTGLIPLTVNGARWHGPICDIRRADSPSGMLPGLPDGAPHAGAPGVLRDEAVAASLFHCTEASTTIPRAAVASRRHRRLVARRHRLDHRGGAIRRSARRRSSDAAGAALILSNGGSAPSHGMPGQGGVRRQVCERGRTQKAFARLVTRYARAGGARHVSAIRRAVDARFPMPSH